MLYKYYVIYLKMDYNYIRILLSDYDNFRQIQTKSHRQIKRSTNEVAYC